jgi:hypothetical protein
LFLDVRDLETVRNVCRHSGNTGAECVAGSSLLPFAENLGLRIPVTVEQYATLLVKSTSEVLRPIFVPSRKIASHLLSP